MATVSTVRLKGSESYLKWMTQNVDNVNVLAVQFVSRRWTSWLSGERDYLVTYRVQEGHARSSAASARTGTL